MSDSLLWDGGNRAMLERRNGNHVFVRTDPRHDIMAEGVGIEPTGDNMIAPHTALKAGTATRRHPLPPTI